MARMTILNPAVFDEAADYIQENGWWKGNGFSDSEARRWETR